METTQYNTLPDNSIISKDFYGDIHFMDSFGIEIETKENFSIDYLTALLFTSVPRWVRLLLAIRDFMVKPFGLETGQIPEQTALDTSIRYNRGDWAVFFSVIDRADSEIVMAEDDKHLYFRTSLYIRKNSDSKHQHLFLTTIVQFHNVWGRIYFALIKPFHKLIIKRMLTNFTKVLHESQDRQRYS